MAQPTIKQLLGAAEAAERAGDGARAIALYRDILTKMPKHSRAKKALAKLERKGGAGKPRMGQGEANQLIAVLNSGDFAATERAARMLIERFQDEPFVYNVLGYAQTQLGQSADAAKSYRWAIRLDPNFVEAYGNLGALYVQIGKHEDAVDVLRKALAKRSTYPEAHHNLGVALAAQGQFDAALSHYDKAIELKPDYGNALNSRGSLHKTRGDFASALVDFRAALKLMPGDRVVTDNLSSVMATLGDVDGALKFTEALLKATPADIELLRRRAVQLNALGRMDEARSAFRDLLDARPDDGEAIGTLLRMAEEDARANLRKTAQDLASDQSVEEHDRVLMGFALAADAEKSGDVETAGRWLTEANGLYRAALPPMPVSDADRFALARRMFEGGVPDHLREAGSPSNRPIFIVGLMRSGTSLVEQIIASHSQVYGAGELEAATEFGSPIMALGLRAKPDDIKRFAQRYLAVLDAADTVHPRTVDKMPANFFMVGLLRTAFPNAAIINTVRDPRDTCFSIWKNFFDTQAHQYAYNQVELAAFANDYKRLMNFWDEVFPGDIYHLRYEDLVADQEGESRKLLEHLDLPWEEGVLEFHKTRRAVRTASVNQVRQKIYTSSVAGWKAFEEHLQPLLNGLDHQLWAHALTGD